VSPFCEYVHFHAKPWAVYIPWAVAGHLPVMRAVHPDDLGVWRGQSDARWPLTSALYREVALQLGRVPTEADLVAAEQRLLRLARSEWRLDGIPALPLFARMQHVGAPTRLIDATLNPLIAVWFAVAAGSDQTDGRLIAFTIKTKIQLDTKWNTNTPRWHPNARFPRP
jgi:FRG domain